MPVPTPLALAVAAAACLLINSSIAAAGGERVYRKTCVFCHEDGAAGAPRKGNRKDWAPRIAQGREVLYRHALVGFRGMPARGANARLSDRDVRAAVDYLIDQASR